MKDVVIVCETDDCENRGKVVNKVAVPERDLETFMDAFGQGGEEDADYCPVCENIGIAYEASEFMHKQEEE